VKPRYIALRKKLQKLLAFQTSHPFAVLAFWVALAACSVIYSAGHLGFQASQRSLISPDNRLMQLLRMADRFSDLDAFVVAIENRDTRKSLEFLGRLGPRLEADHAHFQQVFYGSTPRGFGNGPSFTCPKRTCSHCAKP
jgi:uncharacterized membrane protein YdfJ with MMPL/SSD domain